MNYQLFFDDAFKKKRKKKGKFLFPASKMEIFSGISLGCGLWTKQDMLGCFGKY